MSNSTRSFKFVRVTNAIFNTYLMFYVDEKLKKFKKLPRRRAEEEKLELERNHWVEDPSKYLVNCNEKGLEPGPD